VRPRAFIAGAILVTMLCAPFRAGAAELDHSEGRSLAEHWCAECHQVIVSQRASPNPAAPRFIDIAAGPGASELSLRLLLQSQHATMPQIRMTAEQMDELVSYIMSLKQQQ
jgi:mono/diheme cytochrome c family protein